MTDIKQEFILLCIDNDLINAKEIYINNRNIININEIEYNTETSDIQGPYSLFECMCIKNHINFVKWFFKIGVLDIHYNNGFISACQYNNFEIVKFLYENKNSINLDFHPAFVVSCHLGHIDLVKWLYTNTNNCINIHFDNETPFLYAIEEGHFELAQWLYDTSVIENSKIDINIENNHAFISACYIGRLDICEWLCSISTINKKMDDNMPLKNAILSGNQALIDWLIK